MTAIIRGRGRLAAVDIPRPRGITSNLTSDLSWYRRRRYIHFDLPLSLEDATRYVTDSDRITGHAFYPFLTYDITTPRIKKTPNDERPFVRSRKKRGISYPAHKDGYIFSYYKSLLEDSYEKWLKDNSLGHVVTAFRATGDNNVSLAKKAFDFIKNNPGCQIMATDVESFFDTIDHSELKRVWARFLHVEQLAGDHYAVYRAITRYSVVRRHKAYNLFGLPLLRRLDKAEDPDRLCTPKQFRDKVIPRGLVERNPGLAKGIGIPQGCSLSPLLSNMYMADLDLAMHNWVSSLGGEYWRYCDDILIVIPQGKLAPILREIDSELEKLSLKRSKDKTQKLNSRDLSSKEQIQYLGFIFNGTDVMIRSSSIHRYHRKLKNAIGAAQHQRNKESIASQRPAPLRQKALYNKYSELPLRGKTIRARMANRKYNRNFIKYLLKSSRILNSPSMERQRLKLLKRFRSSIRKNR